MDYLTIAQWVTMDPSERVQEQQHARGLQLSASRLFEVLLKVRDLFEEAVRHTPYCLAVDYGADPNSGEHVLLAYVDDEQLGQKFPGDMLGFRIVPIEIGVRRRQYFRTWRQILNSVLGWPEHRILEWVHLRDLPSKRLLFFYRSPFWYIAPTIIEDITGKQWEGIPLVEAGREIEQLLSKKVQEDLSVQDAAHLKVELQAILFRSPK